MLNHPCHYSTALDVRFEVRDVRQAGDRNLKMRYCLSTEEPLSQREYHFRLQTYDCAPQISCI